MEHLQEHVCPFTGVGEEDFGGTYQGLEPDLSPTKSCYTLGPNLSLFSFLPTQR